MTGTYKLAVAACAWMLATGASARFKYDNDAEVAAARLGVERAARYTGMEKGFESGHYALEVYALLRSGGAALLQLPGI